MLNSLEEKASVFCLTCVILEHRVPDYEPAILTSPQWACRYARDVIKGRWPEAEEIIGQNPGWLNFYKRNVLSLKPERTMEEEFFDDDL